MKTLYKYINALAAAMLVSAGFVSCDRVDYPDRYRVAGGNPTIYSIRYADRDLTITSAYMDEIICILGDNLRSIKELWFNDQKALLNTSYITDNTLIVSVPGKLPVNTTDKIYMINKDKDTTTYGFTVLLPVPKVNTMSFEYAEPGETVTITGNYFSDPFTVEFAGGVEAKTITNKSLTSFDVVIPEGALPGKVKVTTTSGTGQSLFNYKDDRGLLFTFDDARLSHGWHTSTIMEDENSISGKYLQLYNESVEFKVDGSEWADDGYHFEYWAGNWANPETFDDPDGIDLTKVVDFSDFANMSLKFEIRIPSDNPWTGCPMQIYFAGKDLVTLGTGNNTFFRDPSVSLPRVLWTPWKTTGSYDTGGKWITVTFPFASDFIWYWNGEKANGTLSAESFSSFEIFLAGGKAGGEPCTPKFQIDNIRAVPNK